MSVNSVQEIINLSESRSNPNRIAYRHLKKQLDFQIRERAVRYGSLSFRTPSILFGRPAFDKAQVESKILKHYARIGFACYREPGGDDIIIRWKEDDPEENEHEDGSDTSEESESESGSTTDVGSSGGERGTNTFQGPDSDSDGEGDTTKHVVIEKSSLSQRLSDVSR